MDHHELGQLWERAKMDGLTLTVRAWLPGDDKPTTGFVIGRGSKYSIYVEEIREYVEDVRPEWIFEAFLSAPITPGE